MILNKDVDNDLTLRLTFEDAGAASVVTQPLLASGLDSREALIPPSKIPLKLRDGIFTASVPHASGLLVRAAFS